MISSLAKRFLLIFILPILFIVSGASGIINPAMAQDEQEEQETPPFTLDPSSVPQALEPIIIPTEITPEIPTVNLNGDGQSPPPSTVTTVPNTEGGWTMSTAPVVTKQASVGSIEVNVLSIVTSDTAGLLREQDGGFSYKMWRGSSRSTINALFERLPVLTRSPAMRSMMYRLLVSQSEPPEIHAQLPSQEQAQSIEGAFIARRLELLASMGDSRAVTDMLAVTPGRTSSERLLRIESEARLLRGDFVTACALANEFMNGSSKIYWQKLFIFCQILSEQYVPAELSMSLMRELGASDEFLFLMFDSMIRGEIPVIDSLPNPTPLHVAVLGASKARLSGEILSNPVPMVLPAIAANIEVDMETRLQAAEQAVASNVMPVELLRVLYLGVEFDPVEINSPLSTAEISSGPRARALLYQVGIKQSVDSARAEAATMALGLAKAESLYAPVSEAFMTVIEGIPPRSDLVWFAGDAVRAFALTGDYEAARAWLGLLRSNANQSVDAANALVQLVPIVRLAKLDDGSQNLMARYDTLENWMKADGAETGGRNRAVLLFTLLENLGESVDMALWEALGVDEMGEAGILPDPVVWQRLDATGRTGKIGETATLALVMMGNGGPVAAGPLVMGHVTRVLTLNGFEDDARALSVEAALAVGL